MAELPIPVRRVVLSLCELCLAGDGGECHVPGCALWMSSAPTKALADENGRLFVAALRELDEADDGNARPDGSGWHSSTSALLGKRVRVTLDRERATVCEGVFLGFGDGGDIELREDDGLVHHAWPMLEIAEAPASGAGTTPAGTSAP